jgi:WD40 repeat protein/tRNA A-37 threonylcarbamoyl transferase component Bud32
VGEIPTPPAGQAEAAQAASLIAPAGVVIPGYEVLGELGRGGMGVVYKARQTKLNRLVAVKMILSGAHAGSEERQRFLTEAEAVARLQHPNIVQIHEIGEAGGYAFFSLEFCPGGPLAAKLNGTPLPAQEAARLVEALARAVQAAHEAGVVHRDLKPANVLLLADGTPKITDFGLAKKLEGGAGQTASGAILGTPSYMAPEQAEGKSGKVGPAADVYALGAVLYELLTGRPPFKAATALDTVLQVLSEEPVPPRRLLPRLPRDLETICLKCLHKEPRKRYASAADLVADLRRFQEGEPIRARAVGRAERAWRWCRRNPAVAGLLTAVAATLVLGVCVASLFAVWARRNANQAQAAADQARKDRDQARNERDRAEWLVYGGQITLAHQEWKYGDGALAWHHLENCPLDLRGWEYDYLYTLFNSNQRTLRGHLDPVRCVAYSPDGTRLASAGSDQAIKVWDVATGEEAFTLWGHTGAVNGVAFSADGRRLVSGSDDRTVKVWDAETGRELLTLSGQRSRVTSVAFDPDNKLVAGGGDDGTVNVWEADTGQAKPWLLRHKGRVNGVAFSPDGKWLASASRDSLVNVWDMETGRPALPFKGGEDAVYCVAFSPDGQYLAAANQLEIMVWDLKTREKTHSFHDDQGTFYSLAFSPDSRRLASGNSSDVIKVWDLGKGEASLSLKGHRDAVISVAFSPDGQHLASGSSDRTVKVWELNPGQDVRSFKGHTRWVRCVAFSPDGRRLASSSQDGTVRVWVADAGQAIFKLPHVGDVCCVAFHPDGRRLVSAGTAGTVKVWDSDKGKELFALGGQSGIVYGVAFSPDGKQLATAGTDGAIKVWDFEKRVVRRTLKKHAGPVLSVAFSPDGKQLASGGDDHTVEVWSLDTGEAVRTLQGHTDRVRVVAFSFDGKWIASGSNDHTVKVWEADTGRELLTLTGHTSEVNSLAFSPDGKRLVSGSLDHTVKVWETTKGSEVLSLLADKFKVSSVEFSRDGRYLASGGDDWLVKLWSAAAGPTEDEKHRAKAQQYAQRGQWREAATELTRVVQLAPEDHYAWYQAAAALAFLGDVDAYRTHRQAMLQRFGDTQSPKIAERTAKVCLLLPASAEERQRLERLAEFAVTRGANTSILPYFQLALALAAYRQENYQAAETWLRQALAGSASWNLTVPSYLILAMSQHRRGRIQEAQASLTLARRLFDQQAPRSDSDAFTGLWNDGLMCQVLQREAEAVLKGEMAPSK